MEGWLAEPVPVVLAILAAAGYLLAVRRVNEAHPRSPVGAWRVVAWLAGLVALVVALDSPLEPWSEELLTAHMAQHLLIAMVAPPLLAAGAPVTLALRAATPAVRRRFLLPLLHARVVRMVTSPFLAWVLFSGVMWFVHFSPLYEAALDDERLHVLEHTLLLASGLLFWWPVIGADPVPGRWRWGGRMAYVIAQMPVNAAVGLAIYFTPYLLYQHYRQTAAALGVQPLSDQQVAGTLMWGAGDVLLLCAAIGLVAGWVRAEERRDRRAGDGRAIDYRT